MKYVICAWFEIERLIWTDFEGGSWYVEPRDEDDWEMEMFDTEEEAMKYAYDMGLFEIPIQRENTIFDFPVGKWNCVRTIYPDPESLTTNAVLPVSVDECL
jgi:hypothetical protein